MDLVTAFRSVMAMRFMSFGCSARYFARFDAVSLQPSSDGIQPNSDGLQPTSVASHLIAMASNLVATASNLIIAMASNLIAMASWHMSEAK